MYVSRKHLFTAGVLVTSLLLNVVFVSCAADATGPTAASTAEILAKLQGITDRLDSIDAKVGDLRIAGPNGGVTLATVDAARVDSILDLVSYLSHDVAGGSWEGCFEAALGVTGEAGLDTEAKGEGAAHGGAWAGTGAYAGGRMEFKVAGGAKLAGEAQGKISGCVPLGGSRPAARTTVREATVRGAHAVAVPEVEVMLNQLGLTRETMGAKVNGVTALLQGTGLPTAQAVAAAIPLPAGVGNILTDPAGAIGGQLANVTNQAQSLLCSGNAWQARFTDAISAACGYLNGSLPPIGGLFSVMTDFPQLQTAFTAAQNTLGTVETGLSTLTTRARTMCGRVNTLGNASITVLSADIRLFPAYTNLTCP